MPPEPHSFPTRRSSDLYVPSSRLVYTRNPGSYDKLAYPDKIETPIITENAQVIAQLIAGNIYANYNAVPPTSVVQIKRDAPGRSEEHTSELQSPCNLVCRPSLIPSLHDALPIYMCHRRASCTRATQAATTSWPIPTRSRHRSSPRMRRLSPS